MEAIAPTDISSIELGSGTVELEVTKVRSWPPGFGAAALTESVVTGPVNSSTPLKKPPSLEEAPKSGKLSVFPETDAPLKPEATEKGRLNVYVEVGSTPVKL